MNLIKERHRPPPRITCRPELQHPVRALLQALALTGGRFRLTCSRTRQRMTHGGCDAPSSHLNAALYPLPGKRTVCSAPGIS